MGRIQASTGLISGLPIGDTVDKLMQLAGRPRDLVVQRNSVIKQEQIALTELSALLVSVQYVTTNLGKEDLYNQRIAQTSNDSVLSATVTGDPLEGSYQFTPLELVQSHQLLSSGVKTDTAPLGGGTFTFRFGDHVQRSAELDSLGGGQGVARGTIRIIDRSGASAEIDLSTVQTADDVLEAINSNNVINVTATAQGDRIRLTDQTGQTVSNLKVSEIGGGNTAASLGLAGIDVAQNTADGQDILWLTQDLELDLLNDGSGVFADRVLNDIQYELRDGTSGTIDLSPIIPGGSQVDEETTLGGLLEVINAAAPNKLKAEIAPDGDRLLLTDLTAGGGNFTVQSLGESTVLEDLGLDGSSVGGVITGRRILGGLKTVLLSSLEGGRGLGALGGLALTDRSGASDTVDLSGAETLNDVIDLINAAAVGIVARVNQAQNGLELADTTGSSAGNLIVANADATATADKLSVAVNDAVTSVESGDLHLQVIARNTRLEDLNGGAGVARGTLTLYDTNGQKAQLSLVGDSVQTVGDVIRAINRLGLEIEAELNETGDGIRLRDLAHGTQTLRVEEGSSTTAADLHLLGGVAEVQINGQTTQVIDGSTTHTIALSSTDSLQDLRDRINALSAGVTATIWSDGSSKPYRLALQSNQPGRGGSLLVDTSAVFSKNLDFQETVRARDALMALGDPRLGGSSVLISSSSNSFDNVIAGAVLRMKQPSATPVTVTIDTTDTNLVASVKTLVENYNQFREGLLTSTKYDVDAETGSVLTGNATALRLDTDLSRLLSGRFDGVGSIRSLGQLGIEFKDDGTLKLNESKLKSQFAEDPEAVKKFFADEQFGLAAKLDALIERLSGQGNSLLTARLGALDSRIAQNEEKIAFFNARLKKQRDSLYLQFYRMELAISRVRANYSAVDSIKTMPSYILGSQK